MPRSGPTSLDATQGSPDSRDEAELTAEIVALATRCGRYGYRRIAALLRHAGWLVSVKRVERIWRREGLKVPQKQPKRGRLWLNDGSCIRLRPERPRHVWSYDFVEDRTHDGRKFRMLNVIDELTRECLAIRVERRLRSTDVIDVLSDLFILRGVPDHIRSDNGPEFVAKALRDWIAAVTRCWDECCPIRSQARRSRMIPPIERVMKSLKSFANAASTSKMGPRLEVSFTDPAPGPNG